MVYHQSHFVNNIVTGRAVHLEHIKADMPLWIMDELDVFHLLVDTAGDSNMILFHKLLHGGLERIVSVLQKERCTTL